LASAALAVATVATSAPHVCRAEQVPPADAQPVAAAADSASADRYGPFNLLDHRSTYGKYWFPEPLRTGEIDVDNEIRVDYFHAERRGKQEDEVEFELEKSFGLVTVEIATAYESEREREFDDTTGTTERTSEEGIGNIEIAARFPFFQYVSDDRRFDTTFVFDMELALPSGSDISRDTELVPQLANLTRLGDHVAIQTSAGYSMLVGPEEGGLNTLEYAAVFGYELTRNELRLPGVLSVWPLFELEGEVPLNHDERGHNELSGTLGFRVNFDTIKGSPLQPRIGLGYTFPIDSGARDEFDWGIVTSVILEY
jgi:hypothetical protein